MLVLQFLLCDELTASECDTVASQALQWTCSLIDNYISIWIWWAKSSCSTLEEDSCCGFSTKLVSLLKTQLWRGSPYWLVWQEDWLSVSFGTCLEPRASCTVLDQYRVVTLIWRTRVISQPLKFSQLRMQKWWGISMIDCCDKHLCCRVQVLAAKTTVRHEQHYLDWRWSCDFGHPPAPACCLLEIWRVHQRYCAPRLCFYADVILFYVISL